MKIDSTTRALLFGAVLFAGPALADTYTWVDKDGTVHLQDEPPPKGVSARRIQSLPGEPPPAEPAPPRDVGARQGTPPPSEPAPARSPTTSRPAPVVDLFTTGWCPWCKKAREYLIGRGIRFTEHDIDKDASALGRKIGIERDKRVPIVVIDGKVIRGYSPSAYQAALERR